MTKRYKRMTNGEIAYVKAWTEKFDVGEDFTFEGWKEGHADDATAPAATKIGRQVVDALKQTSPDQRLSFIGLSEGQGIGGKVAEKSGAHHQYYVRKE